MKRLPLPGGTLSTLDVHQSESQGQGCQTGTTCEQLFLALLLRFVRGHAHSKAIPKALKAGCKTEEMTQLLFLIVSYI